MGSTEEVLRVLHRHEQALELVDHQKLLKEAVIEGLKRDGMLTFLHFTCPTTMEKKLEHLDTKSAGSFFGSTGKEKAFRNTLQMTAALEEIGVLARVFSVWPDEEMRDVWGWSRPQKEITSECIAAAFRDRYVD